MTSETVVPRSGCRTMRIVTRSAAGTSGTIISLRVEFSPRLEASRCAPHIAIVIFAISDGCRDIPATTNHPRVPCDSVPIPGISTSTSSNTDTANAGNANRRIRRTGICKAT